jgi:hypothetical protein
MLLPLLLGVAGAAVLVRLERPTQRASAFVIVSAAEPVTRVVVPLSVRGADAASRVAHSAAVAERVVRVARIRGLTVESLLQHSRVSPQPHADVLDFSVAYPNGSLAVRLVNLYAAVYARYDSQRQIRIVNRELRALHKKMAELPLHSLRAETLRKTLVELENLKLAFAPTPLLERTSTATPTREHGVRNGLIGGAIGATLGGGLVVTAAMQRRRAERRPS